MTPSRPSGGATVVVACVVVADVVVVVLAGSFLSAVVPVASVALVLADVVAVATATHSVRAALEAQPAGQGMQEGCPEEGPIVPAGQSSHVELPESS